MNTIRYNMLTWQNLGIRFDFVSDAATCPFCCFLAFSDVLAVALLRTFICVTIKLSCCSDSILTQSILESVWIVWWHLPCGSFQIGSTGVRCSFSSVFCSHMGHGTFKWCSQSLYTLFWHNFFFSFWCRNKSIVKTDVLSLLQFHKNSVVMCNDKTHSTRIVWWWW